MKEKLEISKHFDSKLKNLLFKRPILKLISLIIFNFILINIATYLPKFSFMSFVFDLLKLLISIYFVLAVIYIVKNRIEYLMSPSHIVSLMLAYSSLIIICILIFSTFLSIAEITRTGYITYGDCQDDFSKDQIDSDTLISHNYFYFTAITFFTVGYGDICPMGSAKTISVIIALVGHVISVILVALILNNYLKKKKK